MTRSIRLTPAVLKATAGFALTALLVAGCASSKSTPAAAPATSAAAATATSAGAAALAAAAPASVGVKTGPLGAYLVDATGRTLYLFNTDKGSTSSCYTKCAANWPAFVTGGAPQANAGVTASMLGTSARTDGSMQVTYNGHPLYYFGGDQAAGDTNGQGKAGTWWLVAPAGTEIGSAAAAASTSPSAAKTSKSAGGGWS
jgi:predicted lipoprotein with Yx(FWY)xxD motif